MPVGSILLPGELIREESTSFHYVPAESVLHTDARLNERLCRIASELGVNRRTVSRYLCAGMVKIRRLLGIE